MLVGFLLSFKSDAKVTKKMKHANKCIENIG